MRLLIASLMFFAFLNSSCRKSGDKKEEEIVLPATLTGTVDYIEFKNIYEGPDIAHEGVVRIKTSDGKNYYFSFLYLGPPTYIGNGQNVPGEDNATVTFDTASILLPSSTVDPPILQASTYYSSLNIPNALHIKFNEKAQQTHTKGAKEINASFTADTKLLISFFSINDNNALAAQYESDRGLSISHLNLLLKNFNHTDGDASLPAARIWVYYHE